MCCFSIWAVYHNVCNKHGGSNYVGETGRVLRERLYEHRILDHKTAKRSASLNHEDEVKDKGQAGTRRSSRTKKTKDYKRIHEGADQVLSEGNTEFSAHVASDSHEREDLQYSIVCTEENWFKRGVKEAIAIRKLRPTLNKDDGRFHLSRVYDKMIRSSVSIKTPNMGENNAQKRQTSEEGGRPSS